MGVPFPWIKNLDSRLQREDQTHYRALVDHSPDAVLVVCEGEIVFVNPPTLELARGRDAR